MTKITVFIATLITALGLSLSVAAASNDPASYTVAWSQDKNHESYWENALATPQRTVDCTKYEGHNGWIPAEYDAAVIKDGSSVIKVYPDLTNVGGFTATGAINPANGKPYEAPHSWVMKCKFKPVPTTTTAPTTTTTTTTAPASSTTAAPTTTTAATTTVPASSSSVSPTVLITTPHPTVTTVPSTLPATGIDGSDIGLTLVLGVLALVTGLALIGVRRKSTI